MSNPTLTERLCHSLAIMVIEAEITLQHMEPVDDDLEAEVEGARDLIAEAGFDFDVIYPVEQRPETMDSRLN